MKKIVWPGLLAGLVMLIVGMAISNLCSYLWPSLAAEYANTEIFRAWDDPLMSLFFAYYFVLGLILSWAWNKSKELFKGSVWQRGKCFGLSMFLLLTIPGMWMSYSGFQLSLEIILSWTVGGLVYLVLAGTIFARFNK